MLSFPLSPLPLGLNMKSNHLKLPGNCFLLPFMLTGSAWIVAFPDCSAFPALPCGVHSISMRVALVPFFPCAFGAGLVCVLCIRPANIF